MRELTLTRIEFGTAVSQTDQLTVLAPPARRFDDAAFRRLAPPRDAGVSAVISIATSIFQIHNDRFGR